MIDGRDAFDVDNSNDASVMKRWRTLLNMGGNSARTIWPMVKDQAMLIRKWLDTMNGGNEEKGHVKEQLTFYEESLRITSRLLKATCFNKLSQLQGM